MPEGCGYFGLIQPSNMCWKIGFETHCVICGEQLTPHPRHPNTYRHASDPEKPDA